MNQIKVVEYVTRLEFGGVEAMLLNYTSHFKNPELFQMHIITQDINDENCIKQFKEQGYTVHVVTHKRKSIIKNVKEIYKIMKQEKFDVAHSHMNLTNFYVLFIAKMVKVPVRISHSHSAYNDEGLKAKMIYPILKLLNRCFANIWMTCGYEAGVFLYGKKAILKEKVLTVHNAIDLAKFEKREQIREEMRRKYNINDFCVGHIGRFMSVKNHRFIIEICHEIIKINPNTKVLLVGDGELYDEIQEYVKGRSLNKHIIFTGNVTNADELYQAMDVFVLPSLYEGLPVVTIEAQATELPCLISDRVDKRCALTPYVEFMSIEKSAEDWAKAIMQLYEKKIVCDSKPALQNAGYDIETEAKKLEKLYQIGVFE